MHQLNSDTSECECTEATTVTLEWTVRDLKQLFDTSKGENKSKVLKSVLFGGGKWQCLFYPNSGTDNGAYVSLYLSCEPTAEEKENALNGKWFREGLFKFSFELRDQSKKITFNSRDASNHSFSYKTANWGWAQFARRDAVYYHASSVRMLDTFKIICSITSTPTVPAPSPLIQTHEVPQDLLETIGSLLDDPLYSDVEFVFPPKSSSKRAKTQIIWANRAMLRRANYFRNMFEAGFAETMDISESEDTVTSNSRTVTPSDRSASLHVYEDSDEDDGNDIEEDDTLLVQDYALQTREGESSELLEKKGGKRAGEDADMLVDETQETSGTEPIEPRKAPGPKKTRIVIKDFAYTTYKAVLYYLYTDSIVFTPLSSSFVSSITQRTQVLSPNPSASNSQMSLILNSEDQSVGGLVKDPSAQIYDNKTSQETKSDGEKRFASRKEWLKEWCQSKSGRVSPCSAKAVYKLADKLDLKELKERAFRHIIKSLTVSNVAYEVFSSFSAVFEDIRKVQVDYFLSHWSEIRKSDVMRTIWQQIRLGRCPGFEEVWPIIALNLEYIPRAEEKKDVNGPPPPSGFV